MKGHDTPPGCKHQNPRIIMERAPTALKLRCVIVICTCWNSLCLSPEETILALPVSSIVLTTKQVNNILYCKGDVYVLCVSIHILLRGTFKATQILDCSLPSFARIKRCSSATISLLSRVCTCSFEKPPVQCRLACRGGHHG